MTDGEFGGFASMMAKRWTFLKFNEENMKTVLAKFREFTLKDGQEAIRLYAELDADLNGRTFKFEMLKQLCRQVAGRGNERVFEWTPTMESDWTLFIEFLKSIHYPHPMSITQFATQILGMPRAPWESEREIAVEKLKKLGARHISDIRAHNEQMQVPCSAADDETGLRKFAERAKQLIERNDAGRI